MAADISMIFFEVLLLRLYHIASTDTDPLT
jgi:hypothetical protein